MRNKILTSILSVSASVLLASLILITGVLYSYFAAVQQSQLKDELYLAANAVEALGKSYLETADSQNYRLTWIAADGTVLFDNWVEEETMENHGNREEIKEALACGYGSSSRYSTTLMEQNIYEAFRLSDGSVLRISESRATAFLLVYQMLQPISFLIIVIIILSVWMANRMAKRIVEPLNMLNLDKPLENSAYEELSPLLRRIYLQQTKIKEQMQKLQRKQEEFDQITGNMKEALVLLDHNRRIVSINPAAETLFAAENCKGNDFLHVDRTHKMQSAIEDASQNGASSFHENRNGRIYQFELNRIEQETHAIGIAILGFDITEQVNAEQNRRAFTANVSHELKTPLQSIIGFAELLENGIVKEEDIPRFVGNIRKEASRLVCLIEDIIRLSQLDEGVSMPKEEVSLLALSEEVCEILSDAAKMKQISVKVSGDEGRLIGVQRLLYETIYNLCDNAIKYTDSGGSVEISIEKTPDAVCLSVRDNGIGIAPEEQEKIFERFYRVDKSHSRQSGGTGLGLSIVKHAVQYHHGKIMVESECKKGTCISILLTDLEV